MTQQTEDPAATQQTEDPAAILRHINASLAALHRAATTDGQEISEPGRRAFMKKFETEHRCKYCGTVTIDQSLPAKQRTRAVKRAIELHFKRLAAASVRARAARARLDSMAAAAEETMARLGGMAAAAEEQLDAELGELDDEC